MTSSDFIKSEVFKDRINSVMDAVKDVTDETALKNILVPLMTRILLDTFNDGIIANMTERKKISNENLPKKSKEISKPVVMPMEYAILKTLS